MNLYSLVKKADKLQRYVLIFAFYQAFMLAMVLSHGVSLVLLDGTGGTTQTTATGSVVLRSQRTGTTPDKRVRAGTWILTWCQSSPKLNSTGYDNSFRIDMEVNKIRISFGNIMVAIQTQVSYHFHPSILTYPTNKKYSSAQLSTFAIFASLSG